MLQYKVGKNIQRFRLKKKLTQEDLAKRIGVDQTIISRIELGKRNLRLDSVEKLARALRIEVIELFR